MNRLAQVATITLSVFRSLPQRWAASLVVVIGIAGVVGVLISLVAAEMSMNSIVAASGRPNRVIVLDADASGSGGSESYSSLPRATVLAVFDAPGIARDGAGKPIASAEAVKSVRFDAPNGKRLNATLRGVGLAYPALHPEFHLIDGRMFQPGLHEVIAGVGLRARLELAVGSRIHLRDADWTVVGLFQSGDTHESELLGDADTVLSVFRSDAFQSVTARIDSPDALAALKTALAANPLLKVSVLNEIDFYHQRVSTFSAAAAGFSWIIGIIMSLGAVIGALNTMYAAVEARTREIATLRAIGFDAVAVVVSIFAESLLLALIGGAIGAVIGTLIFDGRVDSTLASGNTSDAPVTFVVSLSPSFFALLVLIAAGIGFLGALFPAIRAARLPVTEALQVR
jgi:putative ABC transport system permease protein